MKSIRERPSRIIAVLAVLGWAGLLAAREWPVSGLSWHFFASGGSWLFGGSGLAVYAKHPELQIGPLPLVVAAALRGLGATAAKNLALIAMASAGPLLLGVLAPLVPSPQRLLRIVLAAAFFIPPWTVLAVRWGHLDDVLAMVAAVLAIRAVAAGRPLLLGLALAAAMASKPWAIGFVPLVLALRADQIRAALAAGIGTAAAWLPFVVADAGTLGAMHPPVGLATSSGLHTLGARGSVVPGWGRTVQLIATPAFALVAALRGRWAGVLLVALAVRLALDPQDNGYYLGSVALAAVVFDLLGTRWRIPWTTIISVVALWQPFVRDWSHRLSTTSGLTHWWYAHPSAVGAVHLVWALAMVVVVFAVRPVERREPRPVASASDA